MLKLGLNEPQISRRSFVTGVAAGYAVSGLGLGSNVSFASNFPHQRPQFLTGSQFNLDVGYQPVNFTGKPRISTAINGSVPAPVLRWREGGHIKIKVTNNLAQDSSIHWHGIILSTHMDGVPGLSFDGIKPGRSFEYEFDVNQSGTYWYHSHSGFQEQTGMYGAIVIDPKEPDPVAYDRDYVVLLSDWSDEAPEDIYIKLKKLSHYYNFQERTAGNLWEDIKKDGIVNTWNKRAMWNEMRMSETDISDVTGYTYTFLMNGMTPDEDWTALFKRNERVRLRFINSAAMTIFDIRIPGLKMTVVASDGQNIEPVTIDEFRIGVAETYDVIVEPKDDRAYTLFAQSIDRTGFVRGTLTPDVSLRSDVPEMDFAPILTHSDMGMGTECLPEHEAMGHCQMGDSLVSKKSMISEMAPKNKTCLPEHAAMGHCMMGESVKKSSGVNSGRAGFGSILPINHVDTEFGPHVDMRADLPQNGLNDPGIGLREHHSLYGRKVLNYSDIKNLYQTADRRDPNREIELHLTGNMKRYMWSMNGVKFADAEPLKLSYGERVRITLVNDTMMTHPIHLHGMWSELETGDPDYIPRKHTIIVQPGSKISYLVTADAIGRWAYHCHLLYHMPGMFREVLVV